MRVIVPFAADPAHDVRGLWPETVAALEAAGIVADYIDVSSSPTAYQSLLATVWQAGSAFCIVEMDIVVYPDAIEAMERCPSPWCVTAYNVGSEYAGYLGCVKFGDALVADQPDVFTEINRLPDDGTPRGYWGRLDTRLERVLRERGYTKHTHWPAVGHLNPEKAGLIVNCACGAAIPEAILMSGPGPHQCPACVR